MQLTGFHHLTAITAGARGNHDFYTRTLGLRLVKKTVNQDDVSSYHLFYADGDGSPGTDITFFDWPAARERRGTHSVVRTGFRVASPQALSYWSARLGEMGVSNGGGIVERDGRAKPIAAPAIRTTAARRPCSCQMRQGQGGRNWSPGHPVPTLPSSYPRIRRTNPAC